MTNSVGRPPSPWAEDEVAKEVRIGLNTHQAEMIDRLAHDGGRLKGAVLRDALNIGLIHMQGASNDAKA
jgi:hypothetical protein